MTSRAEYGVRRFTLGQHGRVEALPARRAASADQAVRFAMEDWPFCLGVVAFKLEADSTGHPGAPEILFKAGNVPEGLLGEGPAQQVLWRNG